MAARKSTEPAKPKKQGRPKADDPRIPNRIIIKGKEEEIKEWREYVKRMSPSMTPNGSFVFWMMFRNTLNAEEKAARKNPKSG